MQRRLTRLGFDLSADPAAHYGAATEQAVRRFQEQRGLRIDGICGPQTWGALVEAGYRLGVRLLYLRAPMLRGDDVSELQEALGALGFDAGRVDGIFGPRTVTALEEFQRNAGLTVDGIGGPDSVAALRRVVRPTGSSPPVASVRETQRLLDAPRELRGRRVGIGETGGLAALADAVGRALVEAGAVATVLHHPDESVQAGEANAFNAEAFLSLALCDERRCSTAYYAARAFESIGGRQLAALVLDEVGGDVFPPAGDATGMQLPILRETRMAAVVCEVGPPGLVVEHTAEVAESLTRAFARWARGPVNP
ncbi:MAG: N-acetylmuramoyl-L-alanine amidase [Acidimicrobiaceae bacterium]